MADVKVMCQRLSKYVNMFHKVSSNRCSLLITGPPKPPVVLGSKNSQLEGQSVHSIGIPMFQIRTQSFFICYEPSTNTMH